MKNKKPKRIETNKKKQMHGKKNQNSVSAEETVKEKKRIYV